MLYGKYLFTCCFESEAMLPHFKGSTFRGAFGVALKKVICALRNLQCEECLLNTRCLYARVFETDKPPYPRPFVIEPPLTSKTNYPEGSSFDFGLILLGEDNNNLGYFVYALDQMGKIGIGRRINGRRGHYRLERVTYGDSVIYSSDEQTLSIPQAIENIQLDSTAARKVSCSKVQLDLVTPLRLKFKNRLSGELPFHILVRAMLRRAASLFSCYGDGEPELDYRKLVSRAERIKISQSDLKWFDWRRYSNRQDKAMLMGGIVGSVVYEGDLDDFIPFIDFCTRVHVGKQTTFGLGKIKYEIVA